MYNYHRTNQGDLYWTIVNKWNSFLMQVNLIVRYRRNQFIGKGFFFALAIYYTVETFICLLMLAFSLLFT